MSKLSRLVFLAVLALSIPAAWSDDAPSASAAATAEAAAPASTPPAAAAAPTEPTLIMEGAAGPAAASAQTPCVENAAIQMKINRDNLHVTAYPP